MWALLPFVLLAFAGLVMRGDALGVTLICIPFAALCIWVIRHESPHHISDSSDDDGPTPELLHG